MIKIRFNKEQNFSIKFKYKIKIIARTISIQVALPDKDMVLGDIIESAKPYNSYSLAFSPGRPIYHYRDIPHEANAMFYDLNVIGEGLKRNFNECLNYYNRNGVFAQVDTGMFQQDWRPSENRDIVITVLQGTPKDTIIEADGDYEIEFFDINNATREGFPRDQIWDGYALEVNGRKYIANSHELNIPARIPDETFERTPGVVEYKEGEPVEFTIRKFNHRYTPDKWLTRDIDDDEVFVEITSGLANTKRVYLKNGVGKFTWFPLSYEGKMHVKLGRKWYTVHNDYVLEAKKEES